MVNKIKDDILTNFCDFGNDYEKEGISWKNDLIVTVPRPTQVFSREYLGA